MTDSTSFVLVVLMAGLVIGLWFGKLLSDGRWEAAARSPRMRLRSGGADYYVLRDDDLERAEDIESLIRSGRQR